MHTQIPCFVLGAAEDASQREAVRTRLESRGLQVTFFPLIASSSIDERSLGSYVNIEKNISEYGDVLTRANVAVALSHIAIYRHILNHHIPSAVILENDTDISPDLPALLDTSSANCLERMFGSYEPIVVILTHVEQAYRNHFRPVGSTAFKLVRPYATVRQSRGYFITNAACHNLVKTQYPVWTSADHWEGFVEQDIFRLWALTPNAAWACENKTPDPVYPPKRAARPGHLLSPMQKIWAKTVTETLLVKKLPEGQQQVH